MTTGARDVLKAFEALAPAEQQQVAAEIFAPHGPRRRFA
jgi:hypothetical protein